MKTFKLGIVGFENIEYSFLYEKLEFLISQKIREGCKIVFNVRDSNEKTKELEYIALQLNVDVEKFSAKQIHTEVINERNRNGKLVLNSDALVFFETDTPLSKIKYMRDMWNSALLCSIPTRKIAASHAIKKPNANTNNVDKEFDRILKELKIVFPTIDNYENRQKIVDTFNELFNSQN